MGGIRIAIAGIGNCASALIQGIGYYKAIKEDSPGSSPDSCIISSADICRATLL